MWRSTGLVFVLLALACDAGPGFLPPPPPDMGGTGPGGCQPQCGALQCGVDPVCGVLCGSCPTGQVCQAGSCSTVLPSPCPAAGCPKGSYCDLGGNRCVAGCLDDASCDFGTVCENRQCVAGCRGDTGCGQGQICTNGQCVAGCRGDTGCGQGQICTNKLCVAGCRSDGACGGKGNICDNLMCRAGCRDNTGCNAGFVCGNTVCTAICTTSSCATQEWCDSGGTQLCTACPPDATEPNSPTAAMLSFTELMPDGDWALGLCPGGDIDLFTIVPVGKTLVDHGGVNVKLTVTQADAAAMTTVENLAANGSTVTMTQVITGMGMVTIGTEGAAACSGITCPPNTYRVRVHTDSTKPVTYHIIGHFGS